MRNVLRFSPHFSLFLCLALPSSAVAEPAATEPVFSDSILVIGDPVYLVPIPKGKAVEVAFKTGSLEIEARPIFEARLEVTATCPEVSPDFCASRVKRLRLETRELEDRIRVSLAGMSRREMRKLGVEATIQVPERAPLIVTMGIGELEIEAGPEDLQVGMSIGDLHIKAPEETFGSVGVSTRIGDASLRTVEDGLLDGKRRVLIGAKVKWDEGAGDRNISVKLGIGDAQVELY